MCDKEEPRNCPDHLTKILMGRKDGFFTLESRMFLPHTRSKVFAYFSDAQNLETVTPPWLRFRILTPLPVFMRQGTRILYRLLLHGIPIRWETEITAWEPPGRFVDEQRRGPYLAWIHEHVFEDCPGGCRMTDSVRYSVFGGRIVHNLFVKKDVARIFRYRTEILQKIFASGVNPNAKQDSPGVAL